MFDDDDDDVYNTGTNRCRKHKTELTEVSHITSNSISSFMSRITWSRYRCPSLHVCSRLICQNGLFLFFFSFSAQVTPVLGTIDNCCSEILHE